MTYFLFGVFVMGFINLLNLHSVSLIPARFDFAGAHPTPFSQLVVTYTKPLDLVVKLQSVNLINSRVATQDMVLPAAREQVCGLTNEFNH
jgi:hypothetical protein